MVAVRLIAASFRSFFRHGVQGIFGMLWFLALLYAMSESGIHVLGQGNDILVSKQLR